MPAVCAGISDALAPDMSKQTLRHYDYVNQPYERVQAALRNGASDIFKRATASASERERTIGVQLRVRVGVLEVGTDVAIEVGPPEQTKSSPLGYDITVFPLTWKATAGA